MGHARLNAVANNFSNCETGHSSVLEDFEKKFGWFLIILPGFLSLGLAQYISDIGDVSEFKLICYSMVLTFVNLALGYVIYFPIYKLAELLKRTPKSKTPSAPSVSRHPRLFILIILIVAILTGLVVGVTYENDTLIKLLRGVPGTGMITKRSYQRPLTFLLALNRKGKLEEGRPDPMKTTEAWVKIRLNSGKVFHGYPEFFSLKGKTSEIFLSPACREITRNGCTKIVDIEGPGILISEKDIEFIEFFWKSRRSRRSEIVDLSAKKIGKEKLAKLRQTKLIYWYYSNNESELSS